MRKLRGWLLRRLLGRTFTLIVKRNKEKTLPKIQVGTFMRISFGDYPKDCSPIMIVDWFPEEVENNCLKYRISFLKR